MWGGQLANLGWPGSSPSEDGIHPEINVMSPEYPGYACQDWFSGAHTFQVYKFMGRSQVGCCIARPGADVKGVHSSGA